MSDSRTAREKIYNTVASPYLQNPICLGASIVLHSATKFLAGHSDVMCGMAAWRSELIANIGSMQRLLGTVLDSHASWLLLRGIKSLGIPMQRQTDSALAIARFLKDQTEIEGVNYPLPKPCPRHLSVVRRRPEHSVANQCERPLAQVAGGMGLPRHKPASECRGHREDILAGVAVSLLRPRDSIGSLMHPSRATPRGKS
jgi:Cys/Met metabolism PLP-dependent enzyme